MSGKSPPDASIPIFICICISAANNFLISSSLQTTPTAALNTRRKKVMVKVLKVLQNLVMCDINKGDGAGGLIGQVRHQLDDQLERRPGGRSYERRRRWICEACSERACRKSPSHSFVVWLNQALVPYYRQILPMLNLFTRQNGAYSHQGVHAYMQPKPRFR